MRGALEVLSLFFCRQGWKLILLDPRQWMSLGFPWPSCEMLISRATFTLIQNVSSRFKQIQGASWQNMAELVRR